MFSIALRNYKRRQSNFSNQLREFFSTGTLCYRYGYSKRMLSITCPTITSLLLILRSSLVWPCLTRSLRKSQLDVLFPHNAVRVVKLWQHAEGLRSMNATRDGSLFFCKELNDTHWEWTWPVTGSDPLKWRKENHQSFVLLSISTRDCLTKDEINFATCQ